MSEPDEGRRPLRVLIVDDLRLVRQAFALMLSVEPDILVVGQAGDGAEALSSARALRPDVVLMDVQMPGVDGIEATRSLVAEELGRIIILTTFDRDDYLFDALDAGASGFLLKNSEPEYLAEAIRAAGHDQALLAPEVTKRVIARMSRPPDPSPGVRPAGTVPDLERLTAREVDVLMRMGRGLSNSEIADDLVVAEATVKTHVSNCLAKLGLRDRVHAVIWCYESGLLGGT